MSSNDVVFGVLSSLGNLQEWSLQNPYEQPVPRLNDPLQVFLTPSKDLSCVNLSVFFSCPPILHLCEELGSIFSGAVCCDVPLKALSLLG